MDALVGCDVPVREIGQGGSDRVDAEPASSESVTGCSSKVSWRGASGESENRYLVRGLVAWGLGRVRESIPRPRPCGVEPRASRKIGTSSEALRCGASVEPGYLFEVGRAVQPGLECGGFACGCILVSLFTMSKQSFFGSCLGYPFLWYPTRLYYLKIE